MNDLIDDSSVLIAQNETQAAAITKLRDLLRRLRAVKPPHEGGMIFLQKQVDAGGMCRILVSIREGLREAGPISIDIAILQDDYRKTVQKLLTAYLALCEALFLKTYDPDSYIADGAVAKVTEQSTMNQMDLM